MQSSANESDLFLAHASFLRRLAAQLVRDEHDREDLLQETWTAVYAAGKDGPAGGERPRNPRAWLARIVRNRAANLRRDRDRREDRERAVARSEKSSDSVERDLGVQERVLRAVSELREPYRTAMYLRYYRDLTPTAIADELGVPVTTVDTRLLRGRALLRERLTREFGHRDTWLAALLPLCSPLSPPVPVGSPPGAPTAPPAGSSTGSALSALGAGVVGMKLKIVLCASAIATAALAGWDWKRAAAPALPNRIDSTVQVEAPPTTSAPAPTARDRAETTRARVTNPATEEHSETAREATSTPVSLRLSGIVLGPDGRPIGSTRVRFVGPAGAAEGDADVLADAQGRFQFTQLAGPGKVRVDEPGWTTVVEGALRAGVREDETTIVAAPACELSVRVEDESGAAIEDAQLTVRIPSSLRASLESSFENSADVRIEGASDEVGCFTATIAALAGTRIIVDKSGFERSIHELAADELSVSGRTELTLVLDHLADRTQTLSGRILDDAGNGVVGAVVELGRLGTRSVQDGWFHFDMAREEPFENWRGDRLPARITAASPGFLPVALEVPFDANGEPQWPGEIALQLAQRPLSISGRVVDQNGQPIEGALVFLPKTHLIAGRTTIEAEMRGVDEDAEFFLTERSDSLGRFEFGGLLDEPYDIAALQEGTLLRGEERAVPAGSTGIEIRIDLDDYWREVHGRVLSRSGRAVAGVKLTPQMWTQSGRGGTGSWNANEELPSVTTDEEGRFVLHNIPRKHVTAVLEHPSLMYTSDLEFATAEAREDDRGNLEGCVLRASLRMRFQVQLDDPAEADAFRILDGEQREMRVYAQSANNYNTEDAYYRLTQGRSQHVFVEETAETLVLIREGQPVRRIALTLNEREETRIR